MLRGSEVILRAAEEACCCCVGSVSSDGMFGVDIVECAGACVNAPVMVIDDDYYVSVCKCVRLCMSDYACYNTDSNIMLVSILWLEIDLLGAFVLCK